MRKSGQPSCFQISLLAALCFVVALSPAQAQYTNLHDFVGGAGDGLAPYGSPVISGGTTLYGMTSNGGATNYGVIFRINTDGTDYTNLHEFAGGVGDGDYPYGNSLTLSNTALYGMTRLGGGSNYGVIFSINTDGTGYTNLHSFTGGAGDGKYSSGYLTLSGDRLYGMTFNGGATNGGVIFKINTDGTGYTNLHEFIGGANDGMAPAACSLTLSNDTLYGMTFNGGTADHGVIFSINTDGSGYTNLHSFTGGAGDGEYPYGGSLTLSNDTLYGMTYSGGASYDGVIFRINTDGTGYTNLHEFVGDDGKWPRGSLTLDGATFYGMTQYGGVSNVGVIFSINTDGTSYTNLHEFVGDDGGNPFGSLTLDGTTFYGMTQIGGVSDAGVVFAYALENVTPTAPLTVIKLQTKLNFAKEASDGCNLSATMDLGTGYDLTNKTIAVDVGGTTNVTFALDAKGKGRGTGEYGSCKLAYNKRTGLYALNAKMKKGSWQTAWSDYGMVNSNVPKPGILITNFPVTVTLGETNYVGTAPGLHYTAKTGKSGLAK